MSRYVAVIAAACLCGLFAAAPAAASDNGAITTAAATEDWSEGAFAGSASFDATDCPDGPACTWSAALTLQPSTPAYPCNAENWLPDGDPNVRLEWSSGDQTEYKTVSFDVPRHALLPGAIEQRVCLYVAYVSPVVSGEQRTIADTRSSWYFTLLDPPGGGGGGGGGNGGGGGGSSGGGGTTTTTTSTATQLASISKATAVARAKSALKRKYGKAFNRAKRKKLSCAKHSSTVYRCAYSFRVRHKKRSGFVTVRRTIEGIKTSVKAG